MQQRASPGRACSYDSSRVEIVVRDNFGCGLFLFNFVRVGEGGGLYLHAAQMLLYDPGVKRCGAWHSIADQSPIDY